MKIFRRKQNKLYDLGNRKENVILCQLKNNARNLNADLFNHFLRKNSICDMCGYVSENVYHYFFVCLHFDLQREGLFSQIVSSY